MRLLLLVLAVSGLLLAVPLPPRLEVPLRVAWLAVLAALLTWRLLGAMATQRHILAAWIGWRSPRAPRAYVRDLFDEYAGRYDRHLLHDLGYAAPNLVRVAVGERLAGRKAAVADLGCGTGLCGPLFRPVAAQLVGVDLSPRMLAQARRRGIYDELVEGDLVVFLEGRPAGFDLLIAADVLVYIGDLGPLLRAAAAALRPGGLAALTVEAADTDGDYVLRRTGRYAHGGGYLAATAAEAGLAVLSSQRAVVRREGGEPVWGIVALLAR